MSNADTRLGAVALPNNVTVNYTYFGNLGDKRLQTIQNQVSGATISQFDYTYCPNGNIATWQTLQNSTTSKMSFDYDRQNRIIGAVQQNSTGTPLHQWGYGYDAVGNRTSSSIDATATKTSFNNLNQAQGTIGGGNIRFAGFTDKSTLVTIDGQQAYQPNATNFVAYPSLSVGTNTLAVVANDFNGNTSTNNYSYVVSGSSDTSPTYDYDGETLSTSGHGYTWDAYNRILTVSYTGGATSTFTYDGLHRRVRDVEKDSSGTITADRQWVYGQGAFPLEEWDGLTSVRNKQFCTEGEKIGSASYVYTTDHLGSVRELVGSTGSLGAQYAYGCFGDITKLMGSADADYLYAGLQTLNGELYATNRELSSHGWLSRDPSEEHGGLNLYSYVSNTPINAVDPFGLRDIYVVIWNKDLIHAGVGHAMATELSGRVILSQFPDPHGTYGANLQKTVDETRAFDERDPDMVFIVHIPDDKDFDSTVFDHSVRLHWNWWPRDSKSETNCVYSVDSALNAGWGNSDTGTTFWLLVSGHSRVTSNSVLEAIQ